MCPFGRCRTASCLCVVVKDEEEDRKRKEGKSDPDQKIRHSLAFFFFLHFVFVEAALIAIFREGSEKPDHRTEAVGDDIQRARMSSHEKKSEANVEKTNDEEAVAYSLHRLL